ncbi:sporulation initiation phosphotransferase [Fictibacillus macauensis ZFHKF-1]|uniref:Sporulation initiation phosphotransferase n=1 Tax=Fictibacillus macauensis ZFHKF-1 TaxID=1196324 RepID=I8J0P7_9BACL|nr:Spo0B C-terminal domain-containing protein [Fictibacillus macauensis]EIT85331.1 sporulation initiation phosphotransferase [Fictibacillus macauensis ZFHKF-1]
MGKRKKWSTLDVVRHARHDWLNDLQLIKTNLSLGRTDRVEEIIAAIVQSSRHESHLMNINVPELAEFLITYNWLKYPIVLSVEVTGQVKDLSKIEAPLLHCCESLIALLNEAVDPLSENKLTLTIFNEEAVTMLTFTLEGTLLHRDQFSGALTEWQAHKKWRVIESYVHPTESVINVELQAHM